jgi:hypothetical protein
MSSPSIEFHKIWIDQCAATEDIRESLGPEKALDYLIGEKLFTFLMASEQDPESPRKCRRSSMKSGVSLPLRRSALISIIWNEQSSLRASIRTWTSRTRTTRSTSHGPKIP